MVKIYYLTPMRAGLTGPSSGSSGGVPASFAANWSVGRASVAGLPVTPQRVSFAFDSPAVDRIDGGAEDAARRGRRVDHFLQRSQLRPDAEQARNDGHRPPIAEVLGRG